jgi:putative transposase
MEKWSFQRIRELVTPIALRGMMTNELGRARISMMVRSMSSNTRPDTLVQDCRLQPPDFSCNARRVHTWGYDRIVGALANLGYKVCDQTVGNVLQRHGLSPAPGRKHTTTWSAFIRIHLALLAGTDFFTAEVLTFRGLVTYYVLFFIHLESRRVNIAGMTVHPDERWMKQIARNVTMEGCGALRDCRYLLHDRDSKYTQSFRAIIASGQVEPLVLPARSPNLNAYAERWVRSVKEECLSKVVLFGERSLRRALSEYVEHYHAERNHQGKNNILLLPRDADICREGPVRCRERLGGLLRYYHQEAA